MCDALTRLERLSESRNMRLASIAKIVQRNKPELDDSVNADESLQVELREECLPCR
jgi:hypothetical protein